MLLILLLPNSFQPSEPLALLQMNYRLVYSVMKMLGLKTLPDYAVPMKEMINRLNLDASFTLPSSYSGTLTYLCTSLLML